MADLGYIRDGDDSRGSARGGGEQSLEAWLRSLVELRDSELSWEEQLNSIRISNVEHLGYLKKKQQQEAYDEAWKAEEEIINKWHNERMAKWDEEKAQMRSDAAAMTEEEFYDRYHFNKELIEEEIEAKEDAIDQEFAYRKKKKKKELEDDLKNEKEKRKRQYKADASERMNAFKSGPLDPRNWKKMGLARGEDGSEKFNPLAMLDTLTKAMADFAKQLNGTIDKIGGYKSAIDTRLQGSKSAMSSGSYWENMSKSLTSAIGASPIIKQADVSEKVAAYVNQGISFNVEQRAMLQVMSGKIATTFNAANGTLLRLIRIQEQDTTAGRLGMESALTAFLNNMYETTEYMTQIAESVKGQLEEAMSLMSGENALSFEYQVQKWLGSMYSTGMSQQSVQGLSGVLGKLAAGQLEGITSGGQGNLVIMAANNAGMNISDILQNGLNADTTNELMTSMVDYLAKIYNEAGDSKVIQQQMASVYGMTASDLRAAVNLAKSAGVVSRDGLTYATAMNRLTSMAGSMGSRTSTGEMLTNAWENFQYSMAAGIANNPALYGIYKSATLLDNLAGGIALPDIKVMGSGFNPQTTVADLMRVAALGDSALGGMGAMISGLAAGGNGNHFLEALGINGSISRVSRGSGQGLATTGGASVSSSGSLIGNASGEDMQSKTLADVNDSGKSSLAEAVEETEETKLSEVKTEIMNILDILRMISNGSTILKVDVTNSMLETHNNTL